MDTNLESPCAAFGLKPARATAISGGLEGTSWRVDTETGSFVLRKHIGDTEVSSELVWLEHLARAAEGLAPRPIRTNGGELVYQDSNPAADSVSWSMLTWLEGDKLGRLPTKDEAIAIGWLLGRLHDASRAWSIPSGFALSRYDDRLFRASAAILRSNAKTAISEVEWRTVDEAVERACTMLIECWNAPTQVGIIHSDLHDGNVIWQAGKSTPSAIDFGRCGFGPYALDVAMTQHYLDADTAEWCLEGYSVNRSADFDRSVLLQLRFLAAVENLATLSGHQTELDFVCADMPWLVEQASALRGS